MDDPEIIRQAKRFLEEEWRQRGMYRTGTEQRMETKGTTTCWKESSGEMLEAGAKKLSTRLQVGQVTKETMEQNLRCTAVTQLQQLEMMYPYWRESPPYVLQGDAEVPSDRIKVPEAQRQWAMKMQEEHARQGECVLSPCNWCGNPTGNWCESCKPTEFVAHAICRDCETFFHQCRLCRLRNQWEMGTVAPKVRVEHDSAFLGHFICCRKGCGKDLPKMQLCQKCGCARYCCKECQVKDWEVHREWCKFARQRQPLTLVYSWFWPQATEIAAGMYDPALFPPVRFCGTDERTETIQKWYEEGVLDNDLMDAVMTNHIRVGKRVRIVELVNRMELNGTCGEAKRWDDKTGRWEVTMDGAEPEDKPLGLLPRNLEVIRTEADTMGASTVPIQIRRLKASHAGVTRPPGEQSNHKKSTDRLGLGWRPRTRDEALEEMRLLNELHEKQMRERHLAMTNEEKSRLLAEKRQRYKTANALHLETVLGKQLVPKTGALVSRPKQERRKDLRSMAEQRIHMWREEKDASEKMEKQNEEPKKKEADEPGEELAKYSPWAAGAADWVAKLGASLPSFYECHDGRYPITHNAWWLATEGEECRSHLEGPSSSQEQRQWVCRDCGTSWEVPPEGNKRQKGDIHWYREEIRTKLQDPRCLKACNKVMRKHGWGEEDPQSWFSRVTGLKTPAGQENMEELEKLPRRQRKKSMKLLADLWEVMHGHTMNKGKP